MRRMSFLAVVSVIGVVSCGGGGGGGGGEGPAPFTIIATDPADQATGVPAGVQIRITFSAAANPTSLSYSLEPAVDSGVAWSEGNTRLTITPTAALSASTQYTLTITALTSAAGVALTGSNVLHFTTAAATADFTITATDPPDEATGVSTGTILRFTFSQPAAPASLSCRAVPDTPLGISWSADSRQLSVSAQGGWAAATRYTITLDALTSATGVALSGPNTLHFTTAGVTPGQQYVVWRYPGGEQKPPTLAFSTPPRPAKGAFVADPVYHTRVRRVSDLAADGITSEGLTNEYARADPENADGTRALLRGTDGVWYLYSVPGWQRLRVVSFRNNADPEPRWHPTNPNVCFFVEGPALWRYDVATDQVALVHDFTDEHPACAVVRTRYEGEPSRDCRYWCLRLEDSNYTLLRVVCYDRQTDQVVGRLSGVGSDVDWVSMDMSGTHCVISPGDFSPAVSYHRDFSHPVTLPHGIGHADFAVDTTGRDVLVYQNASTDWIAMADLETGAETNLLPIPFSDNLDIGLHFSGNCDAHPGWVLVSTYGQQATARSWMDQCLFMVRLEPNPVVWRICQTFCIQDPALEKDYFGEAFAAINRQGTRVWWGSNWNRTGADNHRYEAYVAELPMDWETAVLAAAP